MLDEIVLNFVDMPVLNSLSIPIILTLDAEESGSLLTLTTWLFLYKTLILTDKISARLKC